MTEQCTYKLNTNENYKRLIPLLSLDELCQLEQSIIRDGCQEPVYVWNNTIIYGYSLYEIYTRLQIPFTIQSIHFKNCEEAIAWICTNHLLCLNITDETRRYLLGKRYEMEKILRTTNNIGSHQHRKNEVKSAQMTEPVFEKSSFHTSEWLAKEYRISHSTIEKYGNYASALDTLSKVLPTFALKILSGQVKISHEHIVKLSRLSPHDVSMLSKYMIDDTMIQVGYSEIRKILPKKQVSPKKRIPNIPNCSIKNMPVYDPDAEISSLALTIPSWVSSINRTRSVANFSEISINAQCSLENELLALKKTINTILASMKEISNG